MEISIYGIKHVCYSKGALDDTLSRGITPPGSWICQDAGMVQTVDGGTTTREITYPDGNVQVLGPEYFTKK